MLISTIAIATLNNARKSQPTKTVVLHTTHHSLPCPGCGDPRPDLACCKDEFELRRTRDWMVSH